MRLMSGFGPAVQRRRRLACKRRRDLCRKGARFARECIWLAKEKALVAKEEGPGCGREKALCKGGGTVVGKEERPL